MRKPLTDAELFRFDKARFDILREDLRVETEFVDAMRERLRLAEEKIIELETVLLNRGENKAAFQDFMQGLADRVIEASTPLR